MSALADPVGALLAMVEDVHFGLPLLLLIAGTILALVAAGLAFLLVQRGAPARRRTRPEPERRAGDEGR